MRVIHVSGGCPGRARVLVVACMAGLHRRPRCRRDRRPWSWSASTRPRRLELSLEELAALPQVTVATENEFSDGDGQPIAARWCATCWPSSGSTGSNEVRFVAANDYYVDIPTSDFRDYDAILAMEADGETLSRREKGPLWLMYPISDHAELEDPIYLRRLIWQVVRIEAL